MNLGSNSTMDVDYSATPVFFDNGSVPMEIDPKPMANESQQLDLMDVDFSAGVCVEQQWFF